MPTPFMHLQVAEGIRQAEGLPTAAAAALADAWPAFCFGNVAPDFHTLCRQPREETHFYSLPPSSLGEPQQLILAAHPELACPAEMPAAQAAFIAGYCAHLLLDWAWLQEVLIPLFVQPAWWSSWHERQLAHNALLTYLDRLAFGALPAGAGTVLANARPERWLPFAQDQDLVRWRDYLAGQLEPGAPLRTAEIYARRMNMTPAAFIANLDDPQWMQQQIFARVPLPAVQAVLDRATGASIALVQQYLAGEWLVAAS